MFAIEGGHHVNALLSASFWQVGSGMAYVGIHGCLVSSSGVLVSLTQQQKVCLQEGMVLAGAAVCCGWGALEHTARGHAMGTTSLTQGM